MTRTQFRLSVIFSYVLSLFYILQAGLVGIFTSSMVYEKIKISSYYDMYQVFSEFEPIGYIPFVSAVVISVWLLILTLVSFVGLLKFKRWGRNLAIITTLAGLIFAALAGPSEFEGWEWALLSLDGMIWGAVLALAYWSPIHEEFT